MRKAFTTLGFEVYDFTDLWHCHIDKHVTKWEKLITGKERLVEKDMLEVYSACVGMPCTRAHKAILQTYPDCKVVLIPSNPSIRDRIYEGQVVPMMGGIMNLEKPSVLHGQIVRLLDRMWSGWREKEEFLGKCAQVEEEIKNKVPRKNLLIFHESDGWEPLCAFLEVAVPRGKFPQEDFGAEKVCKKAVNEMITFHTYRYAPAVAMVVFFVGAVYWLYVLFTAKPRNYSDANLEDQLAQIKDEMNKIDEAAGRETTSDG